jgi:hypothetical protein
VCCVCVLCARVLCARACAACVRARARAVRAHTRVCCARARVCAVCAQWLGGGGAVTSGSSDDVEAASIREATVEREPWVRFEEVVVRADLPSRAARRALRARVGSYSLDRRPSARRRTAEHGSVRMARYRARREVPSGVYEPARAGRQCL